MKTNRVFFIMIPILLLIVSCSNSLDNSENQNENQNRNKNRMENKTTLKNETEKFNVSQITQISNEPIKFDITFQTSSPFEKEPGIAYSPLFMKDYEKKYMQGEFLNDGIIFRKLYTASKKDPYAAWHIGDPTKLNGYLNFSVATNNNMLKDNKLTFIIVKGLHNRILKVIDNKGMQISEIKQKLSTYKVYHLKSGIPYIFYFEDIQGTRWQEKIKITLKKEKGDH